MEHTLIETIKKYCQELFGVEAVVELERPEEQFGDWSTNVAMRLAKPLLRKPHDIAQELVAKMQNDVTFKSVAVAGPGFINITLQDASLIEATGLEPVHILSQKRWIVEYSCPNYFKELHTGHLYNTILGDVLSRLFERGGAKVKRVTFVGDVGMHVARAVYNIAATVGDDTQSLNAIENKPAFISQHYIEGSRLFEQDAKARSVIEKLNKSMYKIAREEKLGNDIFDAGNFTISIESLRTIFMTCRTWSKQYMQNLYQQIEVDPVDKYYPESATENRGMQEVQRGLSAGIFTESDGAVVFEGEKVDLHTRVFITKAGLPTYEAKDVGVIAMQQDDFSFDKRILLTGNDQREYMRVVWAAYDQLFPGTAENMTHICNGTVRFGDGKKMSSRSGNVTRAVDVLETVMGKIEGAEEIKKALTLGAVKYEFLKHRIGGDIAFNPEESVSIYGNSGPYLQYAHARASSILRKADKQTYKAPNAQFDKNERSMLRQLSMYQESVIRATTDMSPHHICTYLYELAQEFNRFYENCPVLGSDREHIRLWIVHQYRETLRDGLDILGIHAPNTM